MYVDSLASIVWTHCHKLLFELLQTQRRLNRTDPRVHHGDYTEIGRAVDYLDSCFLPVLKSLSGVEEELYKRNENFQFYRELDNTRNATVEAVRILGILAGSNDALTQGPYCSIPAATCRVATHNANVSIDDLITSTSMLIPVSMTS